MALGRYSRVERSSSKSYGSTVTIVVFVGLCLVGIWMMTSSSVIPDQNVNDVVLEKKDNLDDQVTPVINNSNDTSNTLQFEDNSGLPEDARNGDSNVNLNTQENKKNTEENKLDESKKDNKQLDSEGRWTNNNSGENLPEDARKGDSNVNLNTEENKENTEENKLDESKKDNKQLDSEGRWTNNNSGKNLPEDARKGDSNVSMGNLDESKKDNKQLDSEGRWTNNNNGENLPEDARKGDSNASLGKDDGTGNFNTQKNKNTEEGKLDESKKDNKHLDSEGRQRNNNGEDLGGLGGSEEDSDGKKSDRGESYKKSIPDENDEKSGSGSGDKKPDDSSSETNGGKVDDQMEGKVDQNYKNESNKSYDDKKDSEGGQTNSNGVKNSGGLGDSEENPDDKKSDPGESNNKDVSNDKNGKESDSGDREKKPYENSSETIGAKVDGQIEGKDDQNDKMESGKSSGETKDDTQVENQSVNEVFSSGAQSDLLSETITQNGSFSTQATVSKNEKKAQVSSTEYNWKLCNSTAGPDYIPCLDSWEAIRHLRTTKHYEHRERHCPEEPPTCLVPLPEGYRRPIKWPKSRERIWYRNVPHTELAQVKGHQNWVKLSGEYLTFPGGGTQFKHGALLYIDFIEESMPDIAWGKRSRVVLDVGCGVASFGGFLFDRNALTMSIAPKDEHEAQVQFALERGIPAVSAVMGTKKLPFPGRVFDIVHCARCRVPWHIEGGKLLLELNRLLRPGGFFVWSAFPVYQKIPEDVEIWKAMVELTKSMCWELVNKTGKDPVNRVGVAVFKKPTSNDCYDRRSIQKPPLCPESDDPNAAWNVSLKTCMHKVPVDASERGSKWPEQWPARLEKSPYWLSSSQVGVYGKAAPEDFAADYKFWKRVVKSYMNGIGINWSSVRNVMDMKAVYGGSQRFEFVGHECGPDSLSGYPSYYIRERSIWCNIVSVIAEVDRILRPEGKLIVRDNVETINELERMLWSMQWKVRTSYSKDKEGLLCVQKSMWRPKEVETIVYAIA